VTGRQGRICRNLLDDLKERREYSYLKEKALDRTMWRAHFGRGFGPVARQIINEIHEPVSISARTTTSLILLGSFHSLSGEFRNSNPD
jgi:hypothetical protein